MSELRTEYCVACRPDAPAVTDEEIRALKPQIPDWEIVQLDGIPALKRVFTFPDFRSAMDFSNRVGALAEAERHHPRIITEYGKATVFWWTHKIRNLHRNDFICAAKTDELYR